MGVAVARLKSRGKLSSIEVATEASRAPGDFEQLLAACKRVPGGRWQPAEKVWRYPAAIDTCHALRRAFGDQLQVTHGLADWYRVKAAEAQAHAELAASHDGQLHRVPDPLASWLRGYQRAGAAWMAQGYRNAGLVGDVPGLGKTPQTLAAMIEMGLTGPVLIVCPKNAVRLTWGAELAKHMSGTAVYLCQGTREKRQAVLDKFAADLDADWKAGVEVLRVVVVVAEMLRVEMGDACYTESGNKISGMCPNVRRHGFCDKHFTKKFYGDAKARKKDEVPVAFSFPVLFAGLMSPERAWAAVILDESHKLLGSMTIAKANLMGRGLKLLPMREDVRRYALSGTPFGKGGRVQGMFGTLHWLWPDEYTSFWKWAGEVFDIQEVIINRRGATAKKIVGLKGMTASSSGEEAQAAIERFLQTLGPRILRRTKEEVMTDLPPKVYNEVVCPLTPQQERQYRALATLAEVKTSGGMVTPNGGLALLTRERQIANGEITLRDGKVRFTSVSGKTERLMEMLDERGVLDKEFGTKIVVASELNEYLDIVAGELSVDGIPFYRFDGRTSEKERDRAVTAWQQSPTADGDREPRLMLVNTTAAGVSINLDMADEMFIMDEPWNPEAAEQLENRIHRASRVHNVFIYYFRTEGTIDYAKAHSVEMKRQAQHMVLDGRRGMEYVQHLMNESMEEK